MLSVARMAMVCGGLAPSVMTMLPATPPVGSGERSVVPVTIAGASWSSVAPVPVILALGAAPAIGLAMKSAGLSSSEPGTPVFAEGGSGLLARFAVYWSWVVACAGRMLLLNCRTVGLEPTGFPVVGSIGMPIR